MRKANFLLVLFSFTFFNTYAQENKLILTEEFRFHSNTNELIPKQRRTYQYDQLNNLISRTIYEWDKNLLHTFPIWLQYCDQKFSLHKNINHLNKANSRKQIITNQNIR